MITTLVIISAALKLKLEALFLSQLYSNIDDDDNDDDVYDNSCNILFNLDTFLKQLGSAAHDDDHNDIDDDDDNDPCSPQLNWKLCFQIQ